MEGNGLAVAAVVLGISVVMGIWGKASLRKYLQSSKERLLLRNRQMTPEEWNEYEGRRTSFLQSVLDDPKVLAALGPANGDSALKHQWFTAYDLVPGRYDGTIPMSDYLDSLQSESDRTGQMVVETLLAYAQKVLGVSVPLPLTWFMPKKFQNVNSRAIDVLQLLGILSPLQLAASADGKLFIDSRKPTTRNDTPRSSPLPNRFYLAELDSFFSDLDVPGRDAPAVTPASVNPSLFPGLLKGWNPLRHQLQPSVAEARRNKAIAEVCNRLIMNDLLALGVSLPKGFPEELLEVVMPNDEVVTTLPTFIEALQDEGCIVKMYIRTAAAVFGACFTAEQTRPDGEIELLDVPFTLFARSGVYSERLEQEAIVPVLHSGIQLQIGGCLRSTGQQFDCAAQYYLSLNGLCGWNARNGIQDRIPWNKGKLMTQWTSRQQISDALSLCAANTALYTSYANEHHLSKGGYAITGVCTDSIAGIWHAMEGHCDLYPLMALPKHKIGLAHHARRMVNEAGELATRHFLQRLALVLPSLPSDCILDSRMYDETVRRMLNCLPWDAGEEPFLSAELARRILCDSLQSQPKSP